MSSSSSSPKTTTTTSDYRTTNTLNAGLSGDISDALVAAGNYGDTSIFSATDSSDRRITDNSDNSFNLDFADNSDRSVTDNRRWDSSIRDSRSWDNSVRDSRSWDNSFRDSSDNSLKLSMSDSSDRSTTDNSNRSTTDNSNRSTTDNSDRSFNDYSDNSLTVKMNDESDRSVYSYSDSSTTTITDGGAFEVIKDLGGRMITMLGENQLETLKAANSLVERSVVSSANIANQSLSQAMQIKAGQVVTEPVNQNLKEIAKVALVGGAIYAGSKILGK